MKVRTILITCAAFALVIPAAQARTDFPVVQHAPTSSTQIRAMMLRGESLNRRYHLGVFARADKTAQLSAAVRALNIRGAALNRTYGLGVYAPATVGVSDVANSAAVARYQAAIATGRSDALSRYQSNVVGSESTTSGFSSDVANSDAVSRYQANIATSRPDALSRYERNVGRDLTTVPSSGDGVLQSPGTDAGIAAGLLLLISLAGFTLARSRNRPVRPV